MVPPGGLLPDVNYMPQLGRSRTEAPRDRGEAVTGQQQASAAVAQASGQLVLGEPPIQGNQHRPGPGCREEAVEIAV